MTINFYESVSKLIMVNQNLKVDLHNHWCGISISSYIFIFKHKTIISYDWKLNYTLCTPNIYFAHFYREFLIILINLFPTFFFVELRINPVPNREGINKHLDIWWNYERQPLQRQWRIPRWSAKSWRPLPFVKIYFTCAPRSPTS